MSDKPTEPCDCNGDINRRLEALEKGQKAHEDGLKELRADVGQCLGLLQTLAQLNGIKARLSDRVREAEDHFRSRDTDPAPPDEEDVTVRLGSQ